MNECKLHYNTRYADSSVMHNTLKIIQVVITDEEI